MTIEYLAYCIGCSVCVGTSIVGREFMCLGPKSFARHGIPGCRISAILILVKQISVDDWILSMSFKSKLGIFLRL
jgi:hypothetical protein